MTTQTILSNEFYELLYHEEEKIIHHIYTERMSDAQVKELFEMGTQLMRKVGAIKWLSDNRLLSTPFSEDYAQWLQDVWFPDTIAAGWKYWALIVPDSLDVSSKYASYIEKYFEMGLRVSVHVELGSAMEWLIEVDKNT